MRYLALAALTSIAAADYVWPSEHDHMEDLLYLQSGFNRFGFVDGILTCGFSQGETGRQNSAQWIRTAYHDMATADVEAGTGGLDMSIMFETNRDENRGAAFNNTFGHLANFQTIRSSGADLLALAVVGSMAVCGGYEVPLRVGRVDATAAGVAGVPEPTQSVEEHTKSFAKQGFNQTEMIELVACGHTLGGVHHENFPEIVGDDTKGKVTTFEYGESDVEFDNNVVTEYLEGDTSNPLVSGKNDTFNSDKRIFAVDGNKTMQALADPTYFQERCQILMERMINTVPSTVTLSEPIRPVEIKPYIRSLALNTEGTFDFDGYIRVRYGDDALYASGDDISVAITYTDRAGNTTSTIQLKRSTWRGGIATGFHGYAFQFFEWSTQISAEAGISKFDVQVTTTATNKVDTYKNDGNGFPVEDAVLYQVHQSCQNFVQNESGGWDGQLTIAAAIRTDALAASSSDPALHFVKYMPQGTVIDRLETDIITFTKTNQTLAGYQLFEVKNMPINGDSDSSTFDIVLDDTNRVDFIKSTALTQESCKPLVQ